MVADFANLGIYTILDMHQDVLWQAGTKFCSSLTLVTNISHIWNGFALWFERKRSPGTNAATYSTNVVKFTDKRNLVKSRRFKLLVRLQLQIQRYQSASNIFCIRSYSGISYKLLTFITSILVLVCWNSQLSSFAGIHSSHQSIVLLSARILFLKPVGINQVA